MLCKSLEWQSQCNCVMWRQLVQNEFYEGIQSGCAQLGASLQQEMVHSIFGTAALAIWKWRVFICSKTYWVIWTLANFLAPYPRCLMKHALKTNNIGLHSRTREEKQTSNPLEVSHSNICDPLRITSLDGARYFVTFLDHFLMKVWFYALKSEEKCFGMFKELKPLVKT